MPHGGAAGGLDGVEVPGLPSLKLPEEIIFVISELLHLLQVTEEISEEERSRSKISPHLLQLNS